jgi:hypothetical protein
MGVQNATGVQERHSDPSPMKPTTNRCFAFTVVSRWPLLQTASNARLHLKSRLRDQPEKEKDNANENEKEKEKEKETEEEGEKEQEKEKEKEKEKDQPHRLSSRLAWTAFSLLPQSASVRTHAHHLGRVCARH